MYIVIFITASSKKEGRRIARALLKNKLVACVNIVDKISSFFWWQGKIDTAKELLLIIKSKKSLLPKIIKLIKSKHSYDVPEIIVLPIIAGNSDYLRWIDDSVRKSH
jgi:periplasmic divalent cation tolerance protein